MAILSFAQFHERSRWKIWDYAWAGAYFITICTHNREHYFGHVTNGEMQLSHAGILADVFWHEIKNHEKNVELGAFVVMPNHVHGILILTGAGAGNVGTLHATSLHATSLQTTSVRARSPQQKNETMAEISPKPGSVSTIIRSYKSAVTKHANRLGLVMKWQERFHDHVIRNDTEYNRISEYINHNPQKWQSDEYCVS